MPGAISNRLLALLRPEELDRLRPSLHEVPLQARQVLGEAGEPIEHVYFVEAGLASIVAQTGERSWVETALVGRDGMFGVPVLLAASASPHRCIVQIGGTALRMAAEELRQVLRDDPSIRERHLRYAQALSVQKAQSGACNGAHTIEQRLARWLLMAHDRSDGDELPLTHELIAQLLGANRPGVTNGIGALESVGILGQGRSRITILDRPRLERIACRCYGIIRAEYDRLLG